MAHKNDEKALREKLIRKGTTKMADQFRITWHDANRTEHEIITGWANAWALAQPDPAPGWRYTRKTDALQQIGHGPFVVAWKDAHTRIVIEKL